MPTGFLRMATAAGALMLAACATATPRREVIHTDTELPGLPFVPAVRAGHLLFLSGQIGNVPGQRALVEGGVEAQARQTMENIGTVLRAAGLGFADVVKCTVFLVDMADYAPVNAVYASFFGDHPPARSAMAGSGLALGARVEIECIAMYSA